MKYLLKRVDSASSRDDLFNLIIKFRQAIVDQSSRNENLKDLGFFRHGAFRRWDKFWKLNKGNDAETHIVTGWDYTKTPSYDSMWSRIYSAKFPQMIHTSLRSTLSSKYLDKFFQGFTIHVRGGDLFGDKNYFRLARNLKRRFSFFGHYR